MDHVRGVQIACARAHGLAGGAAADLAALPHDRRAAGTVDGSVNAAAADQSAVGRVDDGVDFLFRDIPLDECDAGRI